MAVIIVAFAAKAAVDPNLGKNISKMKGPMGGASLTDLTWDMEKLLIVSIVILVLIIFVRVMKTQVMIRSI